MKIEMLRTLLRNGEARFIGECHDCGAKVVVVASEKGESLFVSGGAIYDAGEKYFFKCDECFAKRKLLEDYRKCEVYSRVVGYLRPVEQWNPGKQAEFVMRKNFEVADV